MTPQTPRLAPTSYVPLRLCRVFLVNHPNRPLQHSYNGGTSHTSTILSAASEEAASAGATLTNETGSGITEALAPSHLARAVALAIAADYTILVLGTGQLLEQEGLDRTTLLLPACQQALLSAISTAAKPARLVIAVVSAGRHRFAG